jgi:succinoglycan biosynthesis transport protein ExoP
MLPGWTIAMQEELDNEASQQFDWERYLDILRRRHTVFVVLVFLGWVTVWGATWFLPVGYKSGTLILVEAPTMPRDYVVPNVNDNLQGRLQSITQQILSRTRLLVIIDKLHLYENGKRSLSQDEKVNKMRKDIEIELVRDARNEISAFRVWYSSPDPHIAQLVTSQLTNLFIEENLRVRAQESENTTEFIGSQLKNASESLADQEAKVRAFRTTHIGELPSQQTSNLQILGGFQSQLQNEQDALTAARQQRDYHQTLLQQYRTLQAGTRTPNGVTAGLPAIDQQLDMLRARLADLSSRYTNSHPEVQQVRAEIAKTEKMKEQLIVSLKTDTGGTERSVETELPDASDPAQNSLVLQLQSQLRGDRLEIANREQAIANLKAKIDEYQGRLNREPAIEQQLAELTRGYEQSQANYNDLLKRKNESQMATSMERMQQGQRFTMLDPPSLPLRPDSPNRMKMCGIAIAAGMGLGVLVVVLLEFLDDRLHTDREIKKLLQIAVISEIPEMPTPSDEKHNRRRLAFGWTLAAIVLFVMLAGSAFSYLHA